MDCGNKILSEEYGELVVDYTLPDVNGRYCYIRVSEQFGVVYVPMQEIRDLTGSLYAYQYLPKLFGLMANDFDPISLVQSGILQTQRPPLSLTGSGVVLAFIDTGIRFAEEVFRNEAGNTRILAIWDQSLQTGEPPEGYGYGTLFTREQINEALRTENPYGFVPTYDDNGHGTALASVAAGSSLEGGNTFLGAAPDADIVVVKLKQARQYLRDYYLVPENVPAYAETDIMLGVKFAESFAVTFQRPVVICMGLGTNSGDHARGSALAQYLDEVASRRSRGVVICGGNEGNAAHHFSGSVPQGRDAYVDAEIRVGEGERGFVLEMWGTIPDVLYATVRTPGGESVPRFRLGLGQSQVYTFVYERTRVIIDSALVEPGSGEELIVFRFEDPTPGVWTIRVSAGQESGSGPFHMWLPITQFLGGETYFLQPDPYVTLTDPGVSQRPVTVAAYNDFNNSFYPNSSRGFLKNGLIKPDLAAPGVDISTALGAQTGTGPAAAITAGAVAQYMEWAVVRRNNVQVESQEIKSYFIRGASRSPDITYPSREWGYGRLNVAGTFEALAGV